MKNGLFKKYVALVLAAIMTLGMATSVFASGSGSPDLTEVTIKGVKAATLGTAQTGSSFVIWSAGYVKITPEQASKDDKTASTFKSAGTPTVTYYKFASGTDVSDPTSLTTVYDPTAGTTDIENGDFFIIKSVGATTKYYKINILVSDAPAGTVTGDSGIHEVVLQVTVPTTLNFNLDPHRISVDPTNYEDVLNQIAESNFYIENATKDAAVMVSFDLTAKLADGVTLVSATDADKGEKIMSDMAETDKNLILGLMGATSVASSTDTPVYTYDNVDDGTANTDPVNFFTEEGVGYIDFLLDKKGGSGGEIKTAFTFYGELNTYAAWAALDVSVSGVYTLTPMNAGVLTATGALGEKLTATDAPAMLKLAANERLTAEVLQVLIVGATNSTAVELSSSATSSKSIELRLSDGTNPASVSKVVVGSTTVTINTYWTYKDGLLTFTKDYFPTLKGFENQSFPLTITTPAGTVSATAKVIN